MIQIATLFLVFLLVSSGCVLKLITNIQHEPYMDEIFHIPQAKQYCANNFSSWDPMITTLPGLYLSAVVLLQPIASLYEEGLSEACTTFNLRAVNVAFSIGNFILLLMLSSRLNKNSGIPKQSQNQHAIHAMVLVLYPVLYFFTWLFYTDPGSTFFTLLMYLLCLHKKHMVASISGVIAILFRQTNVIWVIFCLALTVADELEEQLRLDKKVRGSIKNMNDAEIFMLILKTTFSSLSRFLNIVFNILCKTFWYLIVIICFIVFVFINKGIVVGDRSHHEASYNFPQIFYFLLVSFAFSFTHLAHLSKLKKFSLFVVRNFMIVVIFTTVASIVIRYFTYEHLYLLSDNRHYTFYIWARLFRRYELMRYALIPVYLYSSYQFFGLTHHRGLLWRLCFTACLFASLVPHSLLEFRYFIIPFYILRLNMRIPCTKLLLVELLFYVAVNAATVFIFVSRPFSWPESNELQRFMW